MEYILYPWNDEEGTERVMYIKGSPEAVREAEMMVTMIIRDQPKVVTEEIVVPARACGRIIGRNGDNIRAMCRQSKARITVDRRSREHRDPDHPVKVMLRGTKEQIESALGLITAKVMEEENFRSRGPGQPLPIDEPLPPTSQGEKEGLAGLQQTQGYFEMECYSSSSHLFGDLVCGQLERCSLMEVVLLYDNLPLLVAANPYKAVVTISMICMCVRHQSRSGQRQENGGLESGSHVTTYVSVVRNPHCFWLQLASPESVALDRMTENMTSYYSSPATAAGQALTAHPEVGDLVAACFTVDQCWYRASVQAIKTDDYTTKVTNQHKSPPPPLIILTTVKVYYVDFGDEEEVPLENIYKLLPQYVSFPRQALPCSLAYIKPAKGAEHWPEEASERFADLAHTSQWMPLMARRVGTTPDGRHLVELADTSTSEDIFIDHVLVDEGLAEWESEHTPSQGSNQQTVNSQPSVSESVSQHNKQSTSAVISQPIVQPQTDSNINTQQEVNTKIPLVVTDDSSQQSSTQQDSPTQ
ncbi:TDRKH [Cordylochernes scorpioides]|uniref:TDRKH n=1 Tax=Cordylochernes scorpioides TaxID=51811 RepID=A0ABY6K8T0_9ARAC|nr:TDRKH [Cordylochernes scorpioides]